MRILEEIYMNSIQKLQPLNILLLLGKKIYLLHIEIKNYIENPPEDKVKLFKEFSLDDRF